LGYVRSKVKPWCGLMRGLAERAGGHSDILG
jgi:hypothetical protein